MHKDNHPDEAILNEYLDDTLAPGERMVLEAHLEQCTQCKAQLESLQSVFLALEKLPEVSLEHDLAWHVLRIIPPDFQAMPGASCRTWPVFVLQVLVALALFLFTWPFVERWLWVKLARWLGAETIQEVVTRVGGRLAQWFTRSAAVQNSLEQVVGSWQNRMWWPDWLETSMLEVVLLLVAATLLCVVGNGLLLRPQKDNL